MRRKGRRLLRGLRGQTVASASGLAPLVDVVFLLLLFLVLTARFIPEEERFDIRLPDQEPPSVQQYLEPYRVALRSTPDGPVIYAAGVPLASNEELMVRLKRLPPSIPVLVTGEDLVPYEVVVNAYDVAIAAGRKQIVLGELGSPDL